MSKNHKNPSYLPTKLDLINRSNELHDENEALRAELAECRKQLAARDHVLWFARKMCITDPGDWEVKVNGDLLNAMHDAVRELDKSTPVQQPATPAEPKE